jgi:zinc transport system substrate-binding protein
MRNFKKIIFILIVLVLVLQIFMMKKDEKKVPLEPVVAVSTFALYDIMQNVSAGTIKIVNIIPFGVDAHSFEPTPKLMASLEKSALVIYSGAGLEPWTQGFHFKNKSLDMSQHVKLRELESDEFDLHEHDEHQHGDSKIDPHYWLDFANMIISTNIITQELIKIYPQHKDLYTKNAQKYINNLKLLDSEYKEALSSCRLDSIVTNHNAFSYLSSKYGFHVEALSGLSPETEPNAKDVMRLMKHIEEGNVSTVFFESFVSDKVMKSIAKDVKVDIDTLEPLGNITADEAKNNATYIMIMKKNLKKLSKALMCK